jgi:serine/threonine protein kinase
LDTLGEGGNGVALLCVTVGGDKVVAKIYVPPDKRDLDERELARFESEIKLTSTIRHPNVVRAIESGKMTLGAYSLPFYVMPRAASTLRSFTSHGNDPGKIESRTRLFLRAALGVACLHSYGIVHRDLKPENILIGKNGEPLVADLGIAHVNPDFVSVGVKTLASERLLNRDYYAPEQRFGNTTDVDNRADIYALGDILYELFAGSPPVRSSSPALVKINEAFAVLDPVFGRMTAHEPKDRYQFIEDAIEEISMVFGWILAKMKGARPAESADVATMDKLLRSSNDAHRQRGILIAGQLKEEALPVLHELSGHSRRDIRNAAATALGEITHPSSLPFLMGGLYGGGNRKASTFRPAADTAASAIARYSVDVIIQSCVDLAQPVRPVQLQQMLKVVPKDRAYAAREWRPVASYCLTGGRHPWRSLRA